MAIDQKTKETLITDFFSATGPSYDNVVFGFTFGIDRLWKKKIVETLRRGYPSAPPKKVLDLACGTGILTFLMAEQFPKSEIVAVDISPGYLEVAWRNGFKRGIRNVSFVLSSAEGFVPSEQFDVVTSSYLAKYADLPILVHNLSKLVRPGGTVLFHDFTYPKRPVLKSLFEVYFKLAPTLGGWWHSEWRDVLKRLPHLIRETEWVSELTAALKREQFSHIEIQPLTLEGSALVSAKRI
jgi:demethylmenaquinone methyltransferase/2-methoxy-6-polyprenyl-1,4-benzoquinol methylase